MSIKHWLLFAGFLASSSLYAGGLGNVCMGEDVTLPCNLNGWEFGIQGMHLKPSFRGDTGLTSYTNANNHINYPHLDMNYAWSFQVEGAYHFDDGNDLSLSWGHFEKSETVSEVVGNSLNPISIRKTLRPKWDAV